MATLKQENLVPTNRDSQKIRQNAAYVIAYLILKVETIRKSFGVIPAKKAIMVISAVQF